MKLCMEAGQWLKKLMIMETYGLAKIDRQERQAVWKE